MSEYNIKRRAFFYLLPFELVDVDFQFNLSIGFLLSVVKSWKLNECEYSSAFVQSRIDKKLTIAYNEAINGLGLPGRRLASRISLGLFAF